MWSLLTVNSALLIVRSTVITLLAVNSYSAEGLRARKKVASVVSCRVEQAARVEFVTLTRKVQVTIRRSADLFVISYGMLMFYITVVKVSALRQGYP